MPDLKKEQIDRITQKTVSALLTGCFGKVTDLKPEDFRVDVLHSFFGVYGDSDDKARRLRAGQLARSFMAAAYDLEKQDRTMGCLVVCGFDDAERIVDSISARYNPQHAG